MYRNNYAGCNHQQSGNALSQEKPEGLGQDLQQSEHKKLDNDRECNELGIAQQEPDTGEAEMEARAFIQPQEQRQIPISGTGQDPIMEQSRNPAAGQIPLPRPGQGQIPWPGPMPGTGTGQQQGSENRGPQYSGRPTAPPPNQRPQRMAQTLRVDSGSIQNCMFRFTYIWQSNGEEYWMFPTYLSRNTISGFRWNNRFGWSYFGVSLRTISSFTCR